MDTIFVLHTRLYCHTLFTFWFSLTRVLGSRGDSEVLKKEGTKDVSAFNDDVSRDVTGNITRYMPLMDAADPRCVTLFVAFDLDAAERPARSSFSLSRRTCSLPAWAFLLCRASCSLFPQIPHARAVRFVASCLSLFFSPLFYVKL